MSVILYHNSKCLKSRQALDLLRERGITPDIIEYLKSPPNADKLQEILNLLGLMPRDLMRRKEDVYTEYGLDNPSLSKAELIDFMVKHPILIERPIVLANGKGAIGRPREKVLEVFT